MRARLLFIVFFPLLISGCNNEEIQSEQEIEKEITELFNNLYQDYKVFDVDKFTSYYQDDVIRMGENGKYQVGKEIFKNNWIESSQKSDMVLLDYSQPTVLVGQDQVVTFNTYDELFIDKQTRDTTRVNGTWIGIWKKQDDGSWKLRMTTWHQE